MLALVIVVGLLGLVGWEEDTSGALAGTWTLNFTETSGNDPAELDNGSITITYLTSIEFIGTIEFYTGSGNIDGLDYIVDAGYWVEGQEVSISLYQAGEDPEFDYIDLDAESYSGGDSFSGTYSGEGVYGDLGTNDIDSGTFTATR